MILILEKKAYEAMIILDKKKRKLRMKHEIYVFILEILKEIRNLNSSYDSVAKIGIVLILNCSLCKYFFLLVQTKIQYQLSRR